METKNLKQILSDRFAKDKHVIDEIHTKGIMNSHLMGNKDSQSCVTYPPIQKLDRDVMGVYDEPTLTKNTLYLHIPFCTGICFYCSYKVKKSTEGSDEIDKYIDYLEKEIKLLLHKLKSQKITVETVYIGGGTPSILSVKQLARLLQLIHNNFVITGEFTLETSPETVTLDKIQLAKTLGINRVSMGVESWNNDVLKKINRRHDNCMAKNSIEIFRQAGINEIDIDLIRGLPGQSEDILLDDLIQTASLDIPSMTNYQYNIKPQSVDYKKITPGGYELSHTDLGRYAYYVFEGMSELGYRAGPPVGWFLKNSSTYQHNHLKWKNQLNQLCLGVSSYGYHEGWSFSNTGRLTEYKNMLDESVLPIVHSTRLDDEEKMRRHFIFSLRSYVDIEKFNKIYKIDLLQNHDLTKQIKYLCEIGCLLIEDKKITLTEFGRLFSDQIMMTFYSERYHND